jgi:hypothetical protein
MPRALRSSIILSRILSSYLAGYHNFSEMSIFFSFSVNFLLTITRYCDTFISIWKWRYVMNEEKELVATFRELTLENQRLALANVLLVSAAEEAVKRQYGLRKEPPKGAA